jgi:hypothetical protein
MASMFTDTYNPALHVKESSKLSKIQGIFYFIQKLLNSRSHFVSSIDCTGTDFLIYPQGKHLVTSQVCAQTSNLELQVRDQFSV